MTQFTVHIGISTDIIYTPEEGGLLNWTSMMRLLAIVLGFSLLVLGPVPLSACALFSSKLAECATPETQSRCDQMDMGEGGSSIAAAPDTSCCYTSNAPLSESQYKAPDLSLAEAPVGLGTTWEFPRVEEQGPADVVQDLSPPRLQSLLCTFLI